MYSKRKHGQIVIEKLASCIAVKHTSYKLASSCIAERLKVVLPSIMMTKLALFLVDLLLKM